MKSNKIRQISIGIILLLIAITVLVIVFMGLEIDRNQSYHETINVPKTNYSLKHANFDQATLLTEKPSHVNLVNQVSSKGISKMSELKSSAGFIENKGQYPRDIKYVLEKSGFKTLLFQQGFGYLLNEIITTDKGDSTISHFVNFTLKDGNKNPKIITDGKSSDYKNILYKQIAEVRHFSHITYQDVYPGIDMIFEAGAQRAGHFGLKYSFIVHPGADPGLIKITLEGHDPLVSSQAGDLENYLIAENKVLRFKVGGGIIGEELGEIYTIENGFKTQIGGKYDIDGNVIKFDLASYNDKNTLIIDPEVVNFSLRVSSYYGRGGGAEDVIYDVAVSGDGNKIYVTGASNADDLLTGALATGFQTVKGGGNDAFVAEFDATLSTLNWATYLGGGTEASADDFGFGLVTEQDSETGTSIVYLCGSLRSDLTGEEDTFAGESDGFIARISNDGQVLDWLQNIGGNGIDYMAGIALFGDEVVVTGTIGAEIAAANLDGLSSVEDYHGSNDAIVVKAVKSTGNLMNMTHYGRGDNDRGHDLAIIGNEVYITGSGDEINADGDVNTRIYAAKFDQNLNFISEFIAGRSVHPSNNIPNHGIAASEDGSFLALTGIIPVRNSAIITGDNIQQSVFGGNGDAYLIRLNTVDLSIEWGTYYGGSGFDAGYGVVIDCNNLITFTGTTNSTTGIATEGTFGGAAPGDVNGDVFVAKFDSEGNRIYGRYFGNTGSDVAFGISMNENNGNFVLGGLTRSADSIATLDVFQEEYTNANDGFVSVFCDVIVTETPQDQLEVPLGGSTFFNADAFSCGESMVGYQWYFGDPRTGGVLLTNGSTSNGSILDGTTSDNISIDAVTFGDEGTYCIQVTTTCGDDIVLCAELNVIELTGNPVCLDSSTVLNNPAALQDTIHLEFVDFNANPNISNATYRWTVTAESGNVAGGNQVVDGSNGPFPFTLPMSTPRADLFSIDVLPTAADIYTYELSFEYDDTRRGEVIGSISVDVEVYPFPMITEIQAIPDSFCEDEVPSIAITTDIGPDSITFQRIDANTTLLQGNMSGVVFAGDVPSNTTDIVLEPFSNESNQTLEAVFRIIPFSDNGCPGPSREVSMEVQPNPEIDLSVPVDTICSGSNFSIDFEAQSSPINYQVNGGTSFRYERSPNSDIAEEETDGSGLINQGSINDPLTNTSSIPQTVNYQITATYNDCDISRNVRVVVLPAVEIIHNTGNNLAACSNERITFTVGGSIAGLATTFQIDFQDSPNITGDQDTVIVANADGQVDYSGIFSNNTSEVQQVTATITPMVTIEDGISCEGVSEDFVFEITPIPVVENQELELCSGESLAIDLNELTTGPDNITFQWVATNTVGDVTGFASGNGTEISDQLTLENGTNGTVLYAITASINGCDSEIGVITASIFSEATVALTTNPVPQLCDSNPLPVTITANIDGLTEGGLENIQWFRNDVLIADEIEASITISETGRYRIEVSSVGGCLASAEEEITQAVRAEVMINESEGTNTCSDDEFILRTLVTGGDVDTFQWLRNGEILTGEILDSLVVPGTGNYQVIANPIGACPDSSQVVTVDFFPNPIPIFTIPEEACPHVSIPLLGINDNPAATLDSIQWSVVGSTPLPTFSDANSLSTDLIFGENQTEDLTYNVTLFMRTGNGCMVDTTMDIVLQARPLVGFSFPNDNCSGDLVPSSLNVVRGDTFLWEEISGIDGLTIDDPTDLNTTFAVDNDTDDSIDYQIRLIAVGANNCADTLVQTITVHPQPEMVISGDTDPTCNNQQITLSSLGSDANTGGEFQSIAWFVNGQLASEETTLTTTLLNDGIIDSTYRIVLVGTNTTNCVDSATTSIIVHPDARAELSATQAQACVPFRIDGDIISLTEFPQANSDNYSWEIDSAGTVVATATGINPPTYIIDEPGLSITYRLTAMSNNGCASDIDTFTFNSFLASVADFTPSSQEVCEGEEIIFTNNSVNATTFSWDFGDGFSSIEESPTHRYNNDSFITDTVYTVQLVTETINGCTDSTTQLIRVNPLPEASFTALGICAGELLTVTNNSIGQGTLTYLWSVDDPTQVDISDTSSSEPTFSFPDGQAGDRQFEITLRVTSGEQCVATSRSTVAISSRPTALIGTEPIQCIETAAVFQNLSSNASILAQDSVFIWNYGDGNRDTLNTNETVEHTYETTGIYQVTLTVITTGGCQDVNETEISIIAVPQPQISFTQNPETGCSPVNATFSSEESIVFDAGETYFWDFGNNETSRERNPDVVTFFQNNDRDTTYQVTLTITNQCGSRTANESILVRPVPTARFSTVPFDTGCDDVSITFLNESIGIPDLFIWDFGDGTVDTTDSREPFEYIYQNDSDQDTVFSITLTAINECGRNTTTGEITIIPFNDNAAIDLTLDTNLACVGSEVTAFARGIGGTQGRIINWTFDRQPIGNELEVVFTPTTPGIFDLILEVEVLPCGGFLRDTVPLRVEAGPSIDFEVSNDQPCVGETVEIQNLSEALNPMTVWDFGDGSVPEVAIVPMPHQYQETGIFTITMSLEGANGCTSMETLDISVLPTPQADFTMQDLYCDGDQVFLNNISDGGQSFQWTVEETRDTLETRDFNRQLPAPGLYTITLTAFGNPDLTGCSTSKRMPIRVNPNPVTDFELSQTSVCINTEIEFINNSVDGTDFLWSLWDEQGMNQISILRDTKDRETFLESVSIGGMFIVQLEVANAAGCTQVGRKELEVIDMEVEIDFERNPFCSGVDFRFQNNGRYSDSSRVDFTWRIDTTVVSNEFEPFSIPISKENRGNSIFFDAFLTAQDGGCLLSDSIKNIEVKPFLGCDYEVPEAFFLSKETDAFFDIDDNWLIKINPYDTAEYANISLKIYNENSGQLVYVMDFQRVDGIGTPMIQLKGGGNVADNNRFWYQNMFWDGSNLDGGKVTIGRYYYLLEVNCCRAEESQVETGFIQVIER